MRNLTDRIWWHAGLSKRNICFMFRNTKKINPMHFTQSPTDTKFCTFFFVIFYAIKCIFWMFSCFGSENKHHHRVRRRKICRIIISNHTYVTCRADMSRKVTSRTRAALVRIGCGQSCFGDRRVWKIKLWEI